MSDREEQRELDAFDHMVLRRIQEEGRALQPVPTGISGRNLNGLMKKRDGDRLLMVLAFMASVSWVFLGGFGIAIAFDFNVWVTFALCIVVYSMLLSVLYMVVVLKNRRKRKEVWY